MRERVPRIALAVVSGLALAGASAISHDLYARVVKLFSGSPCAPCYKQNCADGKCMREITPDRVFQEIQKTI